MNRGWSENMKGFVTRNVYCTEGVPKHARTHVLYIYIYIYQKLQLQRYFGVRFSRYTIPQVL